MNAPAVCRIEPLETRIAPATLFALNSANNLLRFDSATPGTIDATIPITGLTAGEVVHGIDFRPATSELFAYAEIESEERWQAIAQTEVCQRWWRHMRDLMPANPDNSPRSAPLREVFHIESPNPRQPM